MAKANIRGIGMVRLSREAANEILSFKNDPQFSASDKFTGHGMDFEKRDIGGIILDDYEEDARELSDDKKRANDERYELMQKEYAGDISKRCKRSFEDKVNDIVLYETIYMIYGTPTEEFKEEVRRRQADYYRKNPRHPYAVIEIKDLLPKKEGGKEGHVGNVVPSRIIEISYKSMQGALVTAKRLGEI